MNNEFRKNKPLKNGCVKICPGCAHKWMSYSESLLQKEQWLNKKLFPWAKKIDPIFAVEPEMRWGYRRKVCLSTAWDSASWKIGLISRRKVIPIHKCPVHSEMIRHSVLLFSQVLPSGSIFPMVYYAQSGTQITLVLKTKTMPDLIWMDENFRSQLVKTGIKGLWIHLHPSAGRKVFSKNSWHLIFGSTRSIDKNGLTYGPKAFQQLIPDLHEHALKATKKFLTPTIKDCLIDLYCGIGTGLSQWANTRCRTIGVELDGEAVECARINAPESRVLRGKCTDRIPQLRKWSDTSIHNGGQHLLYVNPPRTGLEPEVLNWICKEYKPARIAYLSCSAGTLQRDLDYLTKTDYTILKITPYDFFPQSLHVETLVFLQS